MKRNSVLFSMGLLLAATLFRALSMKAAEKVPSIDEIIAQYTKATGDQQALQKHWALDLRGQCESSVSDESGPIQVIVQGSKLLMRLNDGDLLMGFDTDTFWRHPRGQDILKVPAASIAETVAIFDPSRVLHWKEKFPQIRVTGTQKIDDRDAYVIETKPGDPATERLFIDRQSGLLIREEILAKQELFTFADFHVVDGVRVPFTIHQATPGPSYSYKFVEAKHVAKVDEATFQPQ